MRKIFTLITLLSVGLFPFLCGAQGLALHIPKINLNADTSTSIDAAAIVVNTGTSPIIVKVQRRIMSLTSGHLSQFCWAGSCYGPNTSSFTLPADSAIAPGDSNFTFTGNVLPYGILGTDVVYYVFSDANNPADSAWVTFTYDFVAATGIKELNSGESSFLNCSQSNTEDVTYVTYRLSNFKDGKLVIRNITGAAVKEVRLRDKQGTFSISTDGLSEGIYMFCLYCNGDPIAAKKMIIRRR